MAFHLKYDLFMCRGWLENSNIFKDRVGRSGHVLPCAHLNGDISIDI